MTVVEGMTAGAVATGEVVENVVVVAVKIVAAAVAEEDNR
jgi:hypothetical protein